MKIFVWHSIEHATDSYHPEGGVVVVAPTEERARELANSDEWGTSILPQELPDLISDCVETVERVFIMPNAGCC